MTNETTAPSGTESRILDQIVAEITGVIAKMDEGDIEQAVLMQLFKICYKIIVSSLPNLKQMFICRHRKYRLNNRWGTRVDLIKSINILS